MNVLENNLVKILELQTSCEMQNVINEDESNRDREF